MKKYYIVYEVIPFNGEEIYKLSSIYKDLKFDEEALYNCENEIKKINRLHKDDGVIITFIKELDE